ncbi:MAG TPA: polyphenol oxidase family protein [Gemmatimonadales bacterium]|nr:polyphenol oxidase family protein [Gemmatimonadales bacterium]
MLEAGSGVRAEREVGGDVPRYELVEWRARFGVVAGITGRGFDLGLWSGAPVGEVMGRWRAFRRLEPGFDLVVLGNQVHGAEVAVHRPATGALPARGAAGWLQLDGIDGHVARGEGLLLTVTVADCIPVYLLAPEARAVGLLHAGWRGTAAGLLARGVAALTSLADVAPGDIVMHCGVGICGECYEVGSEVMTGCGLGADGPGPWQLDLRERLAEQALALGVRGVSLSSWCTGHHRDRFYSHRASRGADGRMAAYLGFPRQSIDSSALPR